MNPLAKLPYPISFTKMNGTGNDFIIIDHRRPFLSKEIAAEFARLVCRRKFSAGSDGLILIEESEKCDFQWQFFNADGSEAEMCGNGARCAARFAFTTKIAQSSMTFQTLAGVIEAEMVGDNVKIKLTPPCDLQLDQELSLLGENRLVHFVNTGVPHAVCFVDSIGDALVAEEGREIRFHPHFQPAGSNVNFVQVDKDRILVRTYERGVEGETMACGTGAVASAIIAAMIGQAQSPVDVITSGGDKLVVHFTLEQESQEVRDVYLEGPAAFVYQGAMNVEALKGGGEG